MIQESGSLVAYTLERYSDVLAMKQVNYPDVTIETSPIIDQILDAHVLKGSIEMRSEGIAAKIFVLT